MHFYYLWFNIYDILSNLIKKNIHKTKFIINFKIKKNRNNRNYISKIIS